MVEKKKHFMSTFRHLPQHLQKKRIVQRMVSLLRRETLIPGITPSGNPNCLTTGMHTCHEGAEKDLWNPAPNPPGGRIELLKISWFPAEFFQSSFQLVPRMFDGI